jgi:2-keto-myo-inositol isomerase
MMSEGLTRRKLLRGSLAAGAAAAAGTAAAAADAERGVPFRTENGKAPFTYCLNTSTIRGQKLPLEEEVDLAAKAGYDAIEPWIGEIDDYVKRGGSLKDLEQRIRDQGLTVESAIGFPEWIVDDDARRAKGLEEARRGMELVRQLGGKRVAAPPVGATDVAGLDLLRAAERYRALLELGDTIGVVPQVEVWGFSRTLARLGETALVAIESNHPKACILPDVYHLHKGGSAFGGLKLLDGAAIHVFHMNDYPADPPREMLTDAHRVYPGDGAAPLEAALRDLYASGFRGVLSLELFNRDYWQQDPLQVARTGLEKMRAAVSAASLG